jgi:hypothetical protein
LKALSTTAAANELDSRREIQLRQRPASARICRTRRGPAQECDCPDSSCVAFYWASKPFSQASKPSVS